MMRRSVSLETSRKESAAEYESLAQEESDENLVQYEQDEEMLDQMGQEDFYFVQFDLEADYSEGKRNFKHKRSGAYRLRESIKKFRRNDSFRFRLKREEYNPKDLESMRESDFPPIEPIPDNYFEDIDFLIYGENHGKRSPVLTENKFLSRFQELGFERLNEGCAFPQVQYEDYGGVILNGLEEQDLATLSDIANDFHSTLVNIDLRYSLQRSENIPVFSYFVNSRLRKNLIKQIKGKKDSENCNVSNDIYNEFYENLGLFWAKRAMKKFLNLMIRKSSMLLNYYESEFIDIIENQCPENKSKIIDHFKTLKSKLNDAKKVKTKINRWESFKIYGEALSEFIVLDLRNLQFALACWQHAQLDNKSKKILQVGSAHMTGVAYLIHLLFDTDRIGFGLGPTHPSF